MATVPDKEVSYERQICGLGFQNINKPHRLKILIIWVEPAVNDAVTDAFCFHSPQMCVKDTCRFLHSRLLIEAEEKERRGKRGFQWTAGCLKVRPWNLLEISRAVGRAAARPLLSRQHFMLVSFLDLSQVSWDRGRPARPLCHLAANIFRTFASPLGRL